MGSCCSRQQVAFEPMKTSDKSETATLHDQTERDSNEKVEKVVQDIGQSMQNIQSSYIQQIINIQEEKTEKVIEKAEDSDLRSLLDYIGEDTTQLSRFIETQEQKPIKSKTVNDKQNEVKENHTKQPVYTQKVQKGLLSEFLDLNDENLMDQIISEEFAQK